VRRSSTALAATMLFALACSTASCRDAGRAEGESRPDGAPGQPGPAERARLLALLMQDAVEVALRRPIEELEARTASPCGGAPIHDSRADCDSEDLRYRLRRELHEEIDLFQDLLHRRCEELAQPLRDSLAAQLWLGGPAYQRATLELEILGAFEREWRRQLARVPPIVHLLDDGELWMVVGILRRHRVEQVDKYLDHALGRRRAPGSEDLPPVLGVWSTDPWDQLTQPRPVLRTGSQSSR
jgi:hypothetical protein